ncbi:SDR family oxidoreductase [Roseateles depolymerans]|uniref:3-beta hydroxysteroid dehydrogenase n=1 Tax=Roseateles depolymerans TaxID=76731 RepID=A0A0U3ND39_9BURK|nr:SDR family oxidoreductase [Roseateles depolymerans]ALV06400.1 3-beta hydroxysteroid dehydrogenase [Roseateles depolymerans]REG19372.1 nucleoside-diphosphate-sugar epimerase [Roseateles depolymerans]
MRVFVTGASGFVGSAVVAELLSFGHEVRGLVRSADAAARLTQAGAHPLLGTLDDARVLRAGADWAEGVIHTAFHHDFSQFAQACTLDQRAIETLGETLLGSERPLLVTSGLARLAQGRPATEDDLPPPRSDAYPRVSEAAAQALQARGVRAATVRLAPSVHGAGDHGFVPMLIQIARQRGVSAYVGDGLNQWSAVHRLDAARLYRLALASTSPAPRLHAVGEEGIPFREIAEAIGRGLGLPTVSLSPQEASGHFGAWFSHFPAAELSGASQATRERLGWSPSHPGLLEDLSEGFYFQA